MNIVEVINWDANTQVVLYTFHGENLRLARSSGTVPKVAGFEKQVICMKRT